MKLFKSILLATGLVGLLAACNNIDGPSVQQEDNGSSLVINISSGLLTKADPIFQSDDEKRIKDVQLFIFKASDGSLYRYIDTILPQASVSGSWSIKQERVNANEDYKVAVFVNGLSATPRVRFNTEISDIEDLHGKVIYLASSNPDGGQGSFAMYGETPDPVHVGVNAEAPANITVRRYVSRIRLMSVQNKLPESYGQLTITKVFVINAMGKWNVDGSPMSTSNAAPATYGKFNWAGRKWGQSNSDGATNFIAAAADCQGSGPDASTMYPYGSQTFKAYTNCVIDNYYTAAATSVKTFDNGNGDRFYVFPNSCASDAATSTGMSATFNGKMELGTDEFKNAATHNAPTRLVVVATFNNPNVDAGTAYYYPVVIPGMERNKTYDVQLVISGFGSDDPNREPAKGSINTTITVANWEGSTSISQEI